MTPADPPAAQTLDFTKPDDWTTVCDEFQPWSAGEPPEPYPPDACGVCGFSKTEHEEPVALIEQPPEGERRQASSRSEAHFSAMTPPAVQRTLGYIEVMEGITNAQRSRLRDQIEDVSELRQQVVAQIKDEFFSRIEFGVFGTSDDEKNDMRVVVSDILDVVDGRDAEERNPAAPWNVFNDD